MEKVLVFGHKNPDTDSVTSAIALANLKKERGREYIPCILGEINNETKYVLNFFKINKPIYLNDVKLRVSDLKYKEGCFLENKNTLNELYAYMKKENVTEVPISDVKGNYLGMVTMNDLLKMLVNPNYDQVKTSYENILKIAKGNALCRFKEEIDGHVTYQDNSFYCDSILIIENWPEIIKKAILAKVSMIIVVKTKIVNDELLLLAKKNKVNIITTMQDKLYVSKMIILSNYIDNIILNNNMITIDENMYLNDLLTIVNKYRYANYPILSRKKKIRGLLRSSDLQEFTRKKVILVDHNESSQSVDGIEEADILEIVDHHKIGSVTSSHPINFRNMAVGSTNTIIYEMYKEKKVRPSREIAGLMLSGIISDTLMFHSPTTTIYDKKAVDELIKIAKIDLLKYSRAMFESAASLKGKTIEELIYNDFKVFNIHDRKIGIGQMTIINYEKVLKEKNKYLEVIEKIAHEHEYDILVFCITDVINSNTYLLYNKKAETILRTVFGKDDMYEGYELKGVVSRKMQIIPLLMEEL